MTLQTAITDYLHSLTAEGRSPRAVDAYKRDLDRLVAFLGADADVTQVTPPKLLAFASSAAMAGTYGEARHPTSNNAPGLEDPVRGPRALRLPHHRLGPGARSGEGPASARCGPPGRGCSPSPRRSSSAPR